MVLDHYSKESTNAGSNPPSSQMQKRAKAKDKENGDKVVTKGLNIKPKSAQNAANPIEANFQKALVEQNDDFKEVFLFLNEIKMEKYKDVFVENGIEDKETILELNESHLEEMNLPLGHKLKIMKRIKECKKQAQPMVPHFAKPAAAQAAAASTETVTTSSNLLDGQYDEEQNKKEFQEALLAWRTAGKKDEAKSEDPIIHTESEGTGNKAKTK